MKAILQNQKERKELENVLSFWATKVIDNDNEGFYGAIDFFGNVNPSANKGIILNARLLWSFSKVMNELKLTNYKNLAERSYKYIEGFFKDTTDSTVYWEVYHDGKVKNENKICLAQSYALLGISEFYKFSKNEKARTWCYELFDHIETNFYNTHDNNYASQLPVEDDESKNLGTHLHLLEAYTNLYTIDENEEVKERIKNLIQLLSDKFLKNPSYCETDFDSEWKTITTHISYGHNIEVLSILLDASMTIGDDMYIPFLLERFNLYFEEIAHIISNNGAVFTTKNLIENSFNDEYDWWVQTEIIIGLEKLHKITREKKYTKLSDTLWSLIRESFFDVENGEWHAKLNIEKKPISTDKVSMWKSPYHIVRMYLYFI